MISQSTIWEARSNAQRFNDFNLNQRDNFRLQHILWKLSLIINNFEEDIFGIILDLREWKRITEENFNDLIEWISLLDNIKLDKISETKRNIIDFLKSISKDITELNFEIKKVIDETRKLADAGF
jgi:hypothetical protein